MTNVLDDLGGLLHAAGVGVLATSLFQGRIPPDSPLLAPQDGLVALIEVPGLPSMRVHDGRSYSIEQPVIQVLARGIPQDYMDARRRIDAAYTVLDGLSNVTLNGTFYLWIVANQPPYVLRQDDGMGRTMMAFNVRCAKAISAPTPVVPLTSYRQPFTQQQQVAIPATVHRLGTPSLVYATYDAETDAALVTAGRVRIDPASGDVLVSFGAPQSGAVILSSAATPSFPVDFSNTTLVSVPGSVHQLGTKNILVALYDDAIPANAIEAERVRVHQTTFDVTVTFAAPQSGHLVLYGAV